jgi:hypothetical protein
MKRIFSFLSIFVLFTTVLLAQNDDWTKDDRSNIYNDCMGYIGKFPNLTQDNKESLSLCYLDEITKKYSKKEYSLKIDVEIKKIRESTLSICAKNLGLDLSEYKKEEPKKEVNSSVISKENLIGHWKDDASEFWLFETGDYKIQYADGKTAKGTWKLDGDQLSFYKEGFFSISEKTYKILMFTIEKFVYQSITNKKHTFTALRVK